MKEQIHISGLPFTHICRHGIHTLSTKVHGEKLIVRFQEDTEDFEHVTKTEGMHYWVSFFIGPWWKEWTLADGNLTKGYSTIKDFHIVQDVIRHFISTLNTWDMLEVSGATKRLDDIYHHFLPRMGFLNFSQYNRIDNVLLYLVHPDNDIYPFNPDLTFNKKSPWVEVMCTHGGMPYPYQSNEDDETYQYNYSIITSYVMAILDTFKGFLRHLANKQ